MQLADFTVKKIPGGQGKAFIKLFHYSRSCHNGPMTWGLFNPNGMIVGVCAFATPCSENVRASLFGEKHKSRVIGLHRLYTYDNLPMNAESWFVSRAIKGLIKYKPKIRGIISFADSSEGHKGVIYQALNFGYYGTTGKYTFFRDSKGRLRHPRQCGVNISTKEARKRGWKKEVRGLKHRYILITGRDKRDKKKFRKLLKLKEECKP